MEGNGVAQCVVQTLQNSAYSHILNIVLPGSCSVLILQVRNWTNPKCSGDMPLPRIGHATALSGKKAWLCGGVIEKQYGNFND